MVKKPEMPLAPVTMAVRPWISGENVGRFLNIPLLYNGSTSEPMVGSVVMSQYM